MCAACKCLRIHKHIHTYTYIDINININMNININIHICIHVVHQNTRSHARIHAYTRRGRQWYNYTSKQKYVTHTYIHRYIHIYTHQVRRFLGIETESESVETSATRKEKRSIHQAMKQIVLNPLFDAVRFGSFLYLCIHSYACARTRDAQVISQRTFCIIFLKSCVVNNFYACIRMYVCMCDVLLL